MLLEKEIQIGPAEWQLWRDHPTTQAVFNALSDERSIWVQLVMLGDTLDNAADKAMKDTILAIGRVQGLSIILEDLDIYLQEQWAEAQRKKQEAEEEESEL